MRRLYYVHFNVCFTNDELSIGIRRIDNISGKKAVTVRHSKFNLDFAVPHRYSISNVVVAENAKITANIIVSCIARNGTINKRRGCTSTELVIGVEDLTNVALRRKRYIDHCITDEVLNIAGLAEQSVASVIRVLRDWSIN